MFNHHYLLVLLPDINDAGNALRVTHEFIFSLSPARKLLCMKPADSKKTFRLEGILSFVILR
jgi:hypothetical protein